MAKNTNTNGTTTVSTRSAAAVKAWETRRARAQAAFASRSAAARKAWATRRANASAS